MDSIRDTRPWFWILVAALAALAIVALVIAISANNESVDQKQVVNEATGQIKEEVSGLNTAVEAANEFQEESDELAAQDRKQIKREVKAAEAEGEEALVKLKRRVASLEGEAEAGAAELEKLTKADAKLAAEGEALKKSNAGLTDAGKELQAEVAELDKRLVKLENPSR
jgi:chromosome segregation ATPase